MERKKYRNRTYKTPALDRIVNYLNMKKNKTAKLYEIADDLGKSRQAVWYPAKQLEERGIVKIEKVKKTPPYLILTLMS